MDKIITKPSSQEIIIKGSSSEGHVDIYSYDAEQEDDKKSLGNLFMVGNIQDPDGDEPDVQYIINLIASIAKREYYARGDISPKQGFSNALKKVNDVIDEFFKNKDLQINAGLFAIADESIYISRLGKFKIFLARDGNNIDVLNNIEHFSKEHVEERKFSNIISGKVHVGDRVLAYYPNKAITSRERYIKADFVKFDKSDFIDKINGLKEAKKDFACAAIYIDINQHREPTVRKFKPKTSPSANIRLHPDAGTPILADAKKNEAIINPISLAAESSKPLTPADISSHVMPADTLADRQEMPKIIAAEFSLGKKKNPLSSLLRNIHISNINPKKRLAVSAATLVGLGLLVGLGFSVKSLVSSNQTDKQFSSTINQANKDMATAKDEIGANNFITARNLLSSSYASLISSGYNESDKTKNALVNIDKLLDSMDNAGEASVSLFSQIAESDGQVKLIASPGDSIQSILTSKDKLYYASIKTDGISNVFELGGLGADLLLSPFTATYGVISYNNGLGLDVIKDKQVRTIDLTIDNQLKSASLYEDNLYYLSTGKIFKIVDIDTSGNKSVLWSKEDISVNAELLAVDGNIYTIGSDGLFFVYFMGKRTVEKNIQIAAAKGDVLLSTKDGKYLHLLKKDTGRIYLIEKTTGNLAKTIKIGNTAKILDAAISQSEIVYIATSDNKIWKVAY
jgi:hypothetical protein